MVGCSHESSASDVVGRMRMSAAEIERHLASFSGRGVAAVLLSTCHRTELYWWGDADLLSWFDAHVVPRGYGPAVVEQREADLAVRHLFSVTAGMRSARYGEPEIMRQVRTSWTASQDAGVTHALLDAIFRRALEAARHIRLAIGDDADPALGSRVRDTIVAHGLSRAEADGNVAPLQLLVIGAGDAARGVLEALTTDRPRCGHPAGDAWRIAVTSRSDSSAARLASAFGVQPLPWASRDAALRTADVAVFAVHAATPLIDAATATRLTDGRGTSAQWLDLGVPANVDVCGLPASVQWIGLETLAPHSRSNAVRDKRANAALQRELARFATEMHRRQVGARITMLEERAATVARAAFAAASSTPGDTASADAVARQVTRLLLRELSKLSA